MLAIPTAESSFPVIIHIIKNVSIVAKLLQERAFARCLFLSIFLNVGSFLQRRRSCAYS